MMTDTPKKTILLVDDDWEILQLYALVLEKTGVFDVHTVQSAVDALDLLGAGKSFDLAITDVMMAKVDGWELLEAVQRMEEPRMPVVVMTAFDEIGTETKAWRRGASGVYFKGRKPLSELVKLAKIHTGQTRSKFNAT